MAGSSRCEGAGLGLVWEVALGGTTGLGAGGIGWFFVVPTAVINLLAVFRKSSVRPLYFTYDGHWNPNGHRLAAESIYEGLTADKLVPVR